jgi:hypothetical protein
MNLLRKTLFAIFSAAILLLSGCYYDNEEELYPFAYCDTTDVTFNSNIEPIIQRSCAVPGCHVPGGDGNGDFTQFPEILEKVENGSFLNSVKGTGDIPMPPNDPLGACEIRQIELWIADGAPNN